MADAVAALFDRTDLSGIVPVGLVPPVTGSQLAAGFAAHFNKPVTYEVQSPEQFRKALAPIVGEAAADVADHYTLVNTLAEHSFAADRSARSLLGLNVRSVEEWLAALGVA